MAVEDPSLGSPRAAFDREENGTLFHRPAEA